MRRLLLTAAVAAALPATLSAQGYRAVNDLVVIGVNRTTFEVIESRGEGPRGIWCAAADYAERRLGANGRIYIREGRGASRRVSGGKSVVFTTDANSLAQGPSRSVSLTTSMVGVGLPVAHAIQFCRREEFELTDHLPRRN